MPAAPGEFDRESPATCRRALAIVLCLASATGCAHYAIRPVPTALRDPIVQSESGVTLSMAQPADAVAACDADLRGHGVFPVLLHLENHSATDATIARESMRLSSSAGAVRPLGTSDVAERLQYAPIGRYFAWS